MDALNNSSISALQSVIAIGLFSAIAAFLLTSPLGSMSRKRSFFDNPDGDRKQHAAPVPYLGGSAVALSFLLSVSLFVQVDTQVIGLIIGVVIVLLMGHIDDRKGLSPLVKLLVQLFASGVVIASGTLIEYLPVPFMASVVVLSQPIAVLVTLTWMVGIMNAFNFFDGLDGLVSGVTSIAALFLAIILIIQGGSSATHILLSVIVSGAFFGFLPVNFHPAKMFLGDGGAYVAGLLIAALFIFETGAITSSVLIISVPVMDAIRVVVLRLARGKSPMIGDRTHMHHLLQRYASFSPVRITIMTYTVTFALALSVV